MSEHRASAALPACMGGWCAQRDHCAHHVTDDRRYVVERLCERGAERPQPMFAFTPVLDERLAA